MIQTLVWAISWIMRPVVQRALVRVCLAHPEHNGEKRTENPGRESHSQSISGVDLQWYEGFDVNSFQRHNAIIEGDM